MSNFTRQLEAWGTKIITWAGVALTRRKTLDFYGDGVEVEDDPVNLRTRVNIPGGGTTSGRGGFRFTLSETTTDADPTSGTIRISNTTHSSALFLYIDLVSYESGDVTDWLDAITTGDVWLSALGDQTIWEQYTITGAVVVVAGYRKIPVAYVDGNGVLPNTAGGVVLSYDRAGDGFTLSDDPPENVSFAAAYQGDIDEAARVDHKHSLDSGEPTETTDLIPEEGNADTVMRSDARIAHGERGGGTLHPVASDVVGAGFAPDPTGITNGFVIAVLDGELVFNAPVTAPTADEGLLPSDIDPQPVGSIGAANPGVGTLGSRDDHVHEGPVYIVESSADLPAAISNVRTLTAGRWYIKETTTIADEQVDATGAGVSVECAAGDVYLQSTSNTRATLKLPGGHFNYPMRVRNAGTAPALWLSGSFHELSGHVAVGNVKVDGTTHWTGGYVAGNIDFAAGTLLIGSNFNIDGQVLASGTTPGTHGGIQLTNVNKLGGSTLPLVEIPDDINLTLGVYMKGCYNAAGQLLKTGDGINDGGQVPSFTILGCYSGSANTISCEVKPAGGVLVEGCTLHASAPFEGFTATDVAQDVWAFGNRAAASGDQLQNTPNGHIYVNEADADVAQKLRVKHINATTAINGDVIEITHTGSDPLLAAPMKWSTTLADGVTDPGPGYIRGDETIQPNISSLDIDNVTVGSARNVSDWLNYLKAGQLIQILSRTNADRFLIFEITSTPDSSSGFMTLDVLRFSNGPTALGNEELVWLMPYGSRSLALRGGEMDAAATINMNDGQISEIDALYVGKAGVSAPNTGQGLIFSRGNGILEPESIELIAGQGLARARLNTSQGTRPAIGTGAITPVVWQVLHPPPSGQQYSATEIGRPMPVTGTNSFAVQAESHTWVTVTASALSLFALSYASATEGPFGYNPNGWTGIVTIEGTIDFILHTTVDSLKAAHQSVKYSVSWASRNTAPTCRSFTICSLNWPFTPSVAVSGTNCLIAQTASFVPASGARLAASITGRIRAMSHA